MNKDVYMKIAEQMNDKDVLLMLSVNRKFNDPEFFRQIIYQRYPLLIKFRKEGENWKQLYLRMVTHILKLKEEYDVSYIPAASFNPKRIYYEYKIESEYKYGDVNLKSFIFEDILQYIGESGNEVLIQDTIHKHNLVYKNEDLGEMNILLDGIVKGGHLALLKKYGKGFTPKAFTIECAVMSGNKEMIDYIENLLGKRGEKNDYRILFRKRVGAIESGNLDLLKKYRYIDKTAIHGPVNPQNIGECFDNNFRLSGSFEVLKYTLDNVCNFDDMYSDMYWPFIEDEKLSWVKYFIDFYRKSKFYNLNKFQRLLKNLIQSAVQYNAIEILKYLKEFEK